MQSNTSVSGSCPRFDAIDTPVDLINADDLLAAVGAAVELRKKQRIIFCNVSTVVACRQNQKLSAAVREAEVISPDGMPLVWLAKLKRNRRIERVDGPSFIKTAMAHGIEPGWRHYLYGGSPEVLSQLIRNLQEDLPGLMIVGAESPPFREMSEAEQSAAIERINSACPDFVWVGLGMPKQELWMARYRKAIDAPLLLGVGAAFDFHAGATKRAPVWMQRTGLEWSHRLLQEPQRLWKRYLTANVLFLYFVAADLLQALIPGPGRRPERVGRTQ